MYALTPAGSGDRRGTSSSRQLRPQRRRRVYRFMATEFSVCVPTGHSRASFVVNSASHLRCTAYNAARFSTDSRSIKRANTCEIIGKTWSKNCGTHCETHVIQPDSRSVHLRPKVFSIIRSGLHPFIIIGGAFFSFFLSLTSHSLTSSLSHLLTHFSVRGDGFRVIFPHGVCRFAVTKVSIACLNSSLRRYWFAMFSCWMSLSPSGAEVVPAGVCPHPKQHGPLAALAGAWRRCPCHPERPSRLLSPTRWSSREPVSVNQVANANVNRACTCSTQVRVKQTQQRAVSTTRPSDTSRTSSSVLLDMTTATKRL